MIRLMGLVILSIPTLLLAQELDPSTKPKQKSVSSQIEVRRDPFAPSQSRTLMGSSLGTETSIVSGPTRLKVTGIIWDPLRPFAIVAYQGKKQVLSIGDVFDSKEVVEITSKYVTVQYKSEGEVIRLRLTVGKESIL